MVWLLGGTAVLCLLYYIIIVIYSGVSTSFALIWPCLAIFLGLLAAGWWFGSQHEGRIPVWIGDVDEMDEIGYEDYFYGEGICLIEWSERIREILPEHPIQITIEKDLEKGFDYRKISVNEQ